MIAPRPELPRFFFLLPGMMWVSGSGGGVVYRVRARTLYRKGSGGYELDMARMEALWGSECTNVDRRH